MGGAIRIKAIPNAEVLVYLRWLKTVFIFLGLLEPGAIFQVWNCTVFNDCANFLGYLATVLFLLHREEETGKIEKKISRSRFC